MCRLWDLNWGVSRNSSILFFIPDHKRKNEGGGYCADDATGINVFEKVGCKIDAGITDGEGKEKK